MEIFLKNAVENGCLTIMDNRIKTAFLCVNYPKYNGAIGISKKIASQIEALERMGIQTTYSAYCEDGVCIYRDGFLIKKYCFKAFVPKKCYTLLRRFLLMKACAAHLKSNQYDLGFIRWDAVDRCFLKVLKYMRESPYVVMDCHGWFPNMSYTSLKGKYIMLATKKNGGKLRNYIDLCLTESECSQVFDIKAMKIDTGIDVDKYAPHHYTGTKGLHMISVANETAYHGYDRIIYGIAGYYKQKQDDKRDVTLHLVGNISERTKKLIDRLDLEFCIYLYGYKDGTELADVYNSCNMGIGPLAPHRIGGKQGTGIKTKEYFAIGLPYVYAGHELLVPDDYPYVYQVPSDDTPIDVAEILEFQKTLEGKEHIQREMRAFAGEHFSWSTIFHKALESLE